MAKKQTKRALITSVVSLLVCFSMLVGTTFAWFTDSVTSSGNKIASGTLDVDLEVLGDSGWTSVATDNAAIFNYEKWEPGHVEVKVLRVVNKGTLALKWKAALVAEKAISKLGDVIDVYVKEDVEAYPTDRSAIDSWTKVGTLGEFIANISTTTTGVIEPKAAGATEYPYEALGIAFKMQESAGNDYQGLDLGGKFDIKILATQVESESDSFGNDYDAGLDPSVSGNIVVESATGSITYTDEGLAVLTGAKLESGASSYEVPAGVTTLTGGVFTALPGLKSVTLPGSVDNLGRAFDSTSVENVVLNEGLTQIDNRAFKNAKNLASIRIPSTVTEFEEGAFQGSGLEYIVVPENVTLLGKQSLGYCPNVKTIVIEGDAHIINYVARACPNLETVILKGENVTFDISTGSGIYFSNYETGVCDKITFYVQNETVKARLMAADSDVKAEQVIVKSAPATINYDAAVHGSLVDTIWNMTAGDTIIIPAGTYNTSGTFHIPHGVTVKGAEGAEVIIHQLSDQQDNIFNCEGDAVIENITFESNRKGYAITSGMKNHNVVANITVNNCTFKGIATEKNWGIYKNLYGNLTVTNCTFDNYNNTICGVNNQGGSTTVITGCTFTNINGEAIGYIASSVEADFELKAIENNVGLTADNVIGY